MGARPGAPSADARPPGAGDVDRIEPRTETVRDLLTPPGRRRRIAGYLVAIGANALAVAILLPVRDQVSLHSVGFAFLIAAVVSAAVGGFGPGAAGSLIAFGCFNFLFIPPYGTFAIRESEDVIALFVFLGISLTISVLLSRVRQRADAAEERERELLALQRLSSDLVGMGPGTETYEALLGRLVKLFGFDTGGLFVQADTGRGLDRLVAVGMDAETVHADWDPRSPEPPPTRLPLDVGPQHLGLVVLRGERPSLSAAESRILRSFCDQLALVLERDRLLRTATEAEVYRQGEGMRRSLLAAVSHDLRSPLAAIKASVTDLLDPAVERAPEDAREVLETIDRETDRLNALIADLLDMSRIDAGLLRARVEPVDLDAFLPTCASQVERPDGSPRIDVRARRERTVVLADPVFLDRVVANLVGNAVHASRETGAERVEVSVTPEDGRAVVRIVDHGPGIPPSAKEQLFYPFFDLDERNPKLGRGLGLAISKGYVDLMDGQIWVEDTPGGGATLAFALPRVQEGGA
jgi:two-component system sensor histidine kinase KdpD